MSFHKCMRPCNPHLCQDTWHFHPPQNLPPAPSNPPFSPLPAGSQENPALTPSHRDQFCLFQNSTYLKLCRIYSFCICVFFFFLSSFEALIRVVVSEIYSSLLLSTFCYMIVTPSFIHSLAEEHLGHFCFLVIMIKAHRDILV